ncbi:hypothetical protein K474DRAFT_1713868 [Panus rudis PR-1116 ss-1]|nr:hypothetical protein K474DRAFT_1713868 [Panus rudis PR-1116 ss-1]
MPGIEHVIKAGETGMRYEGYLRVKLIAFTNKLAFGLDCEYVDVDSVESGVSPDTHQ